MRRIKYILMPEAYKGNGNFTEKEGTVGELITDTGFLMGADYDKVIPTVDELNKIFIFGSYPRCVEWEPFEISKSEYTELVEYLCALPNIRPYRVHDWE